MSRSALLAIAVLAAGILPRQALSQSRPPAEGAPRRAAQGQEPGQPAARPAADLRAQVAAIRKELDQLKPAAAEAQTVAGTVQQLSGRVSALEQQVERVGRQSAAGPDVVGSIDRLSNQAAALERDVEALRAQVADVEQPAAGAGAGVGAVEYKRGFEWVTGDGAYALKIGGFAQPRYETSASEGLDNVNRATFRLRRARLSLSGHVAREELTYKVQVETATDDAPALDYFIDYQLSPELSFRAGQDKIYFTRVWWASDSSIDIFERPAAVDGVRYDRDIGLWAHGELWGDRLYYHAGVSNGAGPNQRNDNIDLATVVRVEAAVLGERFDAFAGNLTVDPELRFMIGAGAVHDLAQLPERVAGTGVANRDVDADGETDNVRVWSASADAAVRWHGLELVAEGVWRHERWGTILDHTDNEAVAELVDPDSEGVRNYLSGYVHASYPILPDELQVAARVGHSRVALLGIGGRPVDAAPPGDRLFEATWQVRYFLGSNLSFGGSYTFFNYNNRTGPELAGDIEHLIIAQGQLNF
ncbi:MAG TPA: porin [Kofleriaceae bacterium]|nr:porin [Kofleriaceae bacterium]